MKDFKMNMKGNIKKILTAAGFIMVAAGILVLLIAAINKKNNRTCVGFNVQVNSGKGRQFVDAKEVIRLLTGNGADKIVGVTITSFDLKKKEEMIRKNKWIRDVRVFFDNNDVLRIKVMEREPVARVFTDEGESFYIDSSGAQMPIPDKLPAKVPVFTGFPNLKGWLFGSDSTLSRQMTRLSGYIINDPFWMAQIEQININADKTFEMVPEVGNHLIGFGDGNDLEQKFHRLLIFYKEVMARTGFQKYGRIDVRYTGEIVATRRGGYMGKIDSLKAVRNVEQLIWSSQQVQHDDLQRENTLPLEHSMITERTLTNYDLIEDSDENRPRISNKSAGTQGDKKTGNNQAGHPPIKKRINN